MVIKRIAARAIKQVLGSLEYRFTGLRIPQNELLVLCIHSTPRKFDPELKDFLGWIANRFVPFHPDDLQDYFDRPEKFADGPYVLLTFDDGLLNNFLTASVLEESGFHGLFFVVPDFIDAEDPASYYRQHIRPDIDQQVDSREEDFSPMNWGDLRTLIRRGHRVGCHSMTHRLWHSMAPDELRTEILSGRERISLELGVHDMAFCSPNNTLLSVNREAAAMIRENFTFHFTTFPGLNSELRDPQLVLRRNVEVFWPRSLQWFSIGAWDLKRWSPVIEEYRKIL